jgi:hypothetical protein
LHQLRQILVAPSKHYTTVLAALYTIILAEHVFRGTASGWQSHIRGARAFVNQHLDQQPWTQSPDPYIVTQNFALSVLISSTVDNQYSSTAADGVSELESLLHGLMTKPIFGYTLGGTSHILRAIYQTQLLEARLSGRSTGDGPPELEEDTLAQVSKILLLCHVPLVNKVEAYVSHRELRGITVHPHLRTLTRIHLRLFSTAVTIYLFCVVLRCPPSSMAQDVLRVLKDATTFIDTHRGNISIWPLFVAAVEACMQKSQALATHCLDILKSRGAGNRRDTHRVVHQVWAERERLAWERQCDPGEILIDWRPVMRRLKTDILFL